MHPVKMSSVAVLSLALLSGCLNIGPNTIVQDRFKYNQAIRDSWEEQMLTNMVAIRYGESPVFLDVNSVIAQYGLETSARLSGGVNTGVLGGNTLGGGGSAVWSERPTITYSPVEGQEFAVNLLTPIRPAAIFGLIEAGWNAERSLRLLLKTINGVSSYDPTTQRLNPAFFEILDAFKSLQDEEALGIRQVNDAEEVRTFLYLRDVESNAAIDAALTTFRTELRLAEGDGSVEVIFGPYFKNPQTISLQTMSIMDILTESAAYIMVPEVHISEGRTGKNRLFDENDPSTRPSLRVYSSEKKPKDVLVTVRSRDNWYYIDDRDLESKKAFSFLMILMQLTAAENDAKGPVVTIGTGG